MTPPDPRLAPPLLHRNNPGPARARAGATAGAMAGEMAGAMARASAGVMAGLLAGLLAACGGSDGGACARDEDCASRFCRADGTCAPADDAAAPGADAATAGDAGPGGGDGGAGLCAPDHDGTITAAELPLAAGRSATFRVAASAAGVAVSSAGTIGPGGARTWDFTGALAGDADATVALRSPAGAWWQADFPGATYAAPLSATADTLGVFEVSPSAVKLLGVVSPAGGALATKLAYAPPATLLALPFAAGATWTSTSTVSGTYQGVVTAYSETYASRADELGTVKTPYGAFPTIRVATDLTRTSLGVTVLTKRTFAFEVECFGAVATLVSLDDAATAELTRAAEVRRLAP